MGLLHTLLLWPGSPTSPSPPGEAVAGPRYIAFDGLIGPLKLYDGEILDVPMTLTGAGGIPQNLTGATSVTWTVRVPGEDPIVDEVDLEVVDAEGGRVNYVANAELTERGGRYKSLAVVTLPGTPPIVVKFPGHVLIESAVDVASS